MISLLLIRDVAMIIRTYIPSIVICLFLFLRWAPSAYASSPMEFRQVVSEIQTNDSVAGAVSTFSKSWGGDVLISTGGFGLGFFYRNEYSKDFSGFVSFSISESKDDREIEYYDYYTQTAYVPGKKNRFLVLPLMIGVQQRLFSDDIKDNFRPYVSAAVGPTLIYATPYKDEFFASLGKGKSYYTIGGYIGGGVFVGSDRSSLFAINARYYFVPFTRGLESLEKGPLKKDFGGFFLTLTLGSAW